MILTFSNDDANGALRRVGNPLYFGMPWNNGLCQRERSTDSVPSEEKHFELIFQLLTGFFPNNAFNCRSILCDINSVLSPIFIDRSNRLPPVSVVAIWCPNGPNFSKLTNYHNSLTN